MALTGFCTCSNVAMVGGGAAGTWAGIDRKVHSVHVYAQGYYVGGGTCIRPGVLCWGGGGIMLGGVHVYAQGYILYMYTPRGIMLGGVHVYAQGYYVGGVHVYTQGYYVGGVPRGIMLGGGGVHSVHVYTQGYYVGGYILYMYILCWGGTCIRPGVLCWGVHVYAQGYMYTPRGIMLGGGYMYTPRGTFCTCIHPGVLC